MENNSRVLARTIMHMYTGLNVMSDRLCNSYEQNGESVETIVLSNVYCALLNSTIHFNKVNFEEIKPHLIEIGKEYFLEADAEGTLADIEELLNNIKKDNWLEQERYYHSSVSINDNDFSKLYPKKLHLKKK